VTRWIVVGASGFVGSAVVAHLRAAGAVVTPLAAPRLSADPGAGARTLATDAVTHPAVENLAAALRGASLAGPAGTTGPAGTSGPHDVVVVNAAGRATPDAPASAELTGANALLPAVLAVACAQAGVNRLVHLSSAAVQGRRPVLDESPELEPFSPYSAAKAAGEEALALTVVRPPSVVTLRATSVHGPGRPTTEKLARFASSAAASVAGRGDRPTTVCHVDDLAALVRFVGEAPSPPAVVLQPWTGATTGGVLRSLSGGREPRHVPVVLARASVGAGHALARLRPGLAGTVRRVEVLWFGQQQVSGWATEAGFRSAAPDLRA
jgi:nucleoside-diphosphate-sugar epimerase